MTEPVPEGQREGKHDGIPEPAYPEYRLTLVWRADADGNGIRAYLFREGEMLQVSFHPTLNLLEAAESAMTNFFDR